MSQNGKEERQEEGRQEKEEAVNHKEIPLEERGVKNLALFLLLLVHQNDVVAAMSVKELQPFGHPNVKTGAGVFRDFANDVLSIAQPA